MEVAVGAHQHVEHLHKSHNVDGVPPLSGRTLVLDGVKGTLQVWGDLTKEVIEELLQFVESKAHVLVRVVVPRRGVGALGFGE